MVDDAKEDKKKVEQLNQKLHIVGSLTRHDVANKLMVVKTNAYLLRKIAGDNAEVAKYLGGIDAAIDAAKEIFEIGRSYELLGCQELVEVDAGKSFDDAALLFNSLRNIEVINQCHGVVVTADLMLGRLLYNLIGNSLKHGEKVTQIRFYFNKSSSFLRLYYEDNGVGISAENKAKLFLKGFTTGNGSGLGLKLIKDILEVYGWTITEEGKPGDGAKFVITIPSKLK